MADINGTPDDDELFGTTADDLINGGAGNDLLVGDDGNDTINGGDGNDTFFGDQGNDQLSGGNDDDSIWGGAGDDVVTGDDGQDILYGDAGADELYGGAGDDELYGGNDDDTLVGGDGNDKLDGGAGANNLDGGAGDDTLYHEFLSGPTVIDGGGDNDTLVLSFDSESITEAARAEIDTLNQWLAANQANGSNGEPLELVELGVTVSNIENVVIKVNGIETSVEDFINPPDFVNPQAPDDPEVQNSGTLIQGTTGDDTLTGTSDADTILGDAGRDVITGGLGDDEIFGGDDNDRLVGDAGDDVIVGGAGNDIIIGASGHDQLFGGEGNDGFYSGSGDDLVSGGAGNDGVFGEGGNDTIYGGAGDDSLDGGSGDDVVQGGDGNDRLNGGIGDDTLVGGAGDDTLTHKHMTGTSVIDGGADNDTLVLQFQSATVNDAVRIEVDALNQWMNSGTGGSLQLVELGVTVSNIENVIIEVDGVEVALADFVNTTPPNDPEINGTDGDDEIYGSNEADVINGGLGKDTIYGRDGNDEINGGDGNDRLSGEAGDDTIHGGAGNDSIIGHSGNDQLYGGDGNDGFFGGGNDDTIWGENGNDHIFGDGGNDTLYGGADDDRLIGGSGNDFLDGGDGTNTLDGGSGNDTFVHRYQSSTTTIDGGGGFDIVQLMLPTDELSDAARSELATLNDWFVQGLNVSGAELVLSELGVTLANVEEVEITVNGVVTPIEQFLNVAPEVEAEVAMDTREDVSVSGQVHGTDADGDVLTYAVASGPVSGTVTLNSETGEFTYSPEAGFNGEDIFEVSVTDPSGETATQRITVRTEAVADQPTLTISQAPVANGHGIVEGTEGNDFLFDGTASTVTADLNLSLEMANSNGSETIVVTISDLPPGATLSAGIVNSDGSVTLTEAELEGLTITAQTEQDFSISVSAVATEDNGSQATASTTIDIEISDEAIAKDVLDGKGGNDYLFAGRGEDTLIGGSGNDYVSAGDDNDLLIAGSGNDRYIGGNGFDTLDFSQVSGPVEINVANGTATGSGNDIFTQIENFIGSEFADNLIGSSGNDNLNGGAGDDVISGGKGTDVLTGGAGEDTFTWEKSHVKNNTNPDIIADFDISEDELDLSAFGTRRRDADFVLTETTDGTLVSVKVGNGSNFRDVVLLENLYDLDENSAEGSWLLT